MKTVRIPGFVDVEPGTSDPEILHMQVRQKSPATAQCNTWNRQKSPATTKRNLEPKKEPWKPWSLPHVTHNVNVTCE